MDEEIYLSVDPLPMSGCGLTTFSKALNPAIILCVYVYNAMQNRASGDSGFDSPQQHTPVPTPTPSPTEQEQDQQVDATDSLTPSPSPSPSLIPPASPNTLAPRSPIPHSKSHDGFRTLKVYPTPPERSPSAELVRSSPSPSPSPSHKRGGKKASKENKEKKSRSHYVNIFSIGRSKGKDIKAGGSPGASPKAQRKRRASDSPQVLHNTRELSPPSHKPLAQSLHLSFSGGSGSASDHDGQS